MRLEELRLVAYGPFDGQVLSFSRERGVVDVVFGGNEAGKSTSLRALEAFFFGMEHTTPDAHRHRGPDLRIGGRLVTADGSVVDLVRRKGRKPTLRDGADEPVDEAVMQRLLSGVDRELFRALWGLDHVRLRDGARAIFAGKGGVGETLFEAGLAGAGASRLAQTLREEADAIWAPRATTRPLAEALRSLGELRRLAQRDGTTFKGYQDQVDGIAEARREKEALDAELRGIDEERRRLDRAVRVIRPLAERRALVRERAALGE
ncbi:MAG TPA: AAA family ATPase, partial [Polyangiaceae bacterium]|nr:AAA family ATPase [Polyangiaceae bacterium]